jgi:hypothetical protein
MQSISYSFASLHSLLLICPSLFGIYASIGTSESEKGRIEEDDKQASKCKEGHPAYRFSISI